MTSSATDLAIGNVTVKPGSPVAAADGTTVNVAVEAAAVGAIAGIGIRDTPAAVTHAYPDHAGAAAVSMADHRESSSLLDVRIWVARTPWRLAATWVVLTAVLAAGASLRLSEIDWRTLVLLWLLVDPVWGSIWGLVAGRDGLSHLANTGGRRLIWLPYLQSGSPAARLFGWDGHSVLPLLFQAALPGMAVAGLIALVLGPTALAWTSLVVVVSAAGWLHRRVTLVPINFLHSLAVVALPWSLTLNKLDVGSDDPRWAYQVTLLLLWTAHAWGGGRSLRLPGDWFGLALLAGAQLGISLLLVIAQAPLWLALINVLWLPTWLTVYQNRPLHRVQIWWLLAMLMSGLALGQSA